MNMNNNNRTFTITYDENLFETNNHVNVHLGSTGLSIQFSQLANGNVSSQVYLQNSSSEVPVSSAWSELSIDPTAEIIPSFEVPNVPRGRNSVAMSPPPFLRRNFDVSDWHTEVMQQSPIVSVPENPIFDSDSTQADYEEFIESISMEIMEDNQENQENQCSICLNQMTEQTTYTTGCNHSFHRQCLDIWENNNSSCPLCRANLLI